MALLQWLVELTMTKLRKASKILARYFTLLHLTIGAILLRLLDKFWKPRLLLSLVHRVLTELTRKIYGLFSICIGWMWQRLKNWFYQEVLFQLPPLELMEKPFPNTSNKIIFFWWFRVRKKRWQGQLALTRPTNSSHLMILSLLNHPIISIMYSIM